MSDSHSISATRDNERTSTAPKVALIWLAATMTASSLPVRVLIAQMFPLAPFLWVVLLASLLYAQLTFSVFAIDILICSHEAEALTAVPASGHFNALQALGSISLALMGGAFSWTMFASNRSRCGCIIDNSRRDLHAVHSTVILGLLSDSSGFVNYFSSTLDRYYDSLYFTVSSTIDGMVSIAARLEKAISGAGILTSKYGVLAKTRFKQFTGRYAHWRRKKINAIYKKFHRIWLSSTRS